MSAEWITFWFFLPWILISMIIAVGLTSAAKYF
jgi:hypothetical protein